VGVDGRGYSGRVPRGVGVTAERASQPLHVGLNLLYLLPGEVGGTETYARSLVAELDALDGDDRYTLYVNREAAGLFDDAGLARCTVSVCPVDAARRWKRYAYEQLRLARRARSDGVDVLHSLGYVGPRSTHCPHVVTIHDLIYVGFADTMAASKRRLLRFFVRRSARHAARVITVSSASKAAIVDDIGLAPSRVTVIHEAARRDLLADRGSTTDDDEVLRRHGVVTPYVVAFSSASANKNIPALLDAFAAIPGGAHLEDGRACALVLVGRVPADGKIAATIDRLGLGDRVVVTGYVADADIAVLIGNAVVFAFPSRYEGFGLPVLEAQLLGVPVVASNAASIPEVAGDGALLFDPRSAAEIASALATTLGEADVRDDLVRRGRMNAARFSWERAAQATREVYRESFLGSPGAA